MLQGSNLSGSGLRGAEFSGATGAKMPAPFGERETLLRPARDEILGESFGRKRK